MVQTKKCNPHVQRRVSHRTVMTKIYAACFDLLETTVFSAGVRVSGASVSIVSTRLQSWYGGLVVLMSVRDLYLLMQGFVWPFCGKMRFVKRVLLCIFLTDCVALQRKKKCPQGLYTEIINTQMHTGCSSVLSRQPGT